MKKVILLALFAGSFVMASQNTTGISELKKFIKGGDYIRVVQMSNSSSGSFVRTSSSDEVFYSDLSALKIVTSLCQRQTVQAVGATTGVEHYCFAN